jgi:D-glycerate 3-kinase
MALADVLLPWCLERLRAARGRPWVLGLQGPQGCGKSTAAASLLQGAVRQGLRAAAVSIDDFYLTHAEQLAVAARYPGNPTMLYRGYPGTHDVALGARVIRELADPAPGQVLVPAYDKSAHAGRGDRRPGSQWSRVELPLDFVIVEGWMLGFAPVDEAGLDADLSVPNALLAAYAAWNQQLDAFVHMDVESLDTIVTWRVDSERARRDRGETALSDEDARDYIHRFLPAYRAWASRLREHPPCADALTLVLAPDRSPKEP